jgi:hypothetical protein
VGGLEEREADGDAEVDDAVAEDLDGAVLVELARQAGSEIFTRRVLPTVELDELRPLVGLGGLDEGKEVGQVEAGHGVEVARLLIAPLDRVIAAVLGEVLGDLVLERLLIREH